jgi:hypothetical protein
VQRLCDNLLFHLRPEACGTGLGARPGVHLEGLGPSRAKTSAHKSRRLKDTLATVELFRSQAIKSSSSLHKSEDVHGSATDAIKAAQQEAREAQKDLSNPKNHSSRLWQELEFLTKSDSLAGKAAQHPHAEEQSDAADADDFEDDGSYLAACRVSAKHASTSEALVRSGSNYRKLAVSDG